MRPFSLEDEAARLRKEKSCEPSCPGDNGDGGADKDDETVGGGGDVRLFLESYERLPVCSKHS